MNLLRAFLHLSCVLCTCREEFEGHFCVLLILCLMNLLCVFLHLVCVCALHRSCIVLRISNTVSWICCACSAFVVCVVRVWFSGGSRMMLWGFVQDSQGVFLDGIWFVFVFVCF